VAKPTPEARHAEKPEPGEPAAPEGAPDPQGRLLAKIAVLLAYSLLVLWVLKIGREARDRFGITLCVGVSSMLFGQVAVNIGMFTGLLPVVGVTLPLICYGGSSALTVMLALGLVMNVSVRRFAY